MLAFRWEASIKPELSRRPPPTVGLMLLPWILAVSIAFS